MRRKLLIAIAAAGVAACVAPTPVAAHGFYPGTDTYQSGDVCVTSASAIDHGNYGWGFASAYAESSTTLLWSIPCGWAYDRPPGYLAAQWQLFKWNGSSWQLCNYSGWQYNGSIASWLQIEKHFAGYNICGYAYYGVQGAGYVYHDGWKGGWIWSGYHYLPAWA